MSINKRIAKEHNYCTMSDKQDKAKDNCFGQCIGEDIRTLLFAQYGLHLNSEKKSAVGAGSNTWFLNCAEGEFILKYPAVSEINHPESEPALCAFLRKNGIPACDFLKNKTGRSISRQADGQIFTVQRRFPGVTPEWNSASETVLLESAELLGKIHSVLRNYSALPEGIGAGFFANMTPQRALTSYRNSLATAVQRGHWEIADELEWRISLMERFPALTFDLNRLTLCNTHGDYFISQFLCKDGHLTAVIDWTTACVHPAIWEIMRSFVYGAPCCAEGEIDPQLLERYIAAYCRYGTLNAYDRENLYKLYFYQIAVCDYYGQYYTSNTDNREIYLRQARLATKLLKHMDLYIQRENNSLE